jgi:hypothetical protein
MAKRRARRHEMNTDPEALAEDLEQEGWLAYHVHRETPEPERWLDVQHAMNDYVCTWMYNTQYKQAKKKKFTGVVPILGLDLTPLKSLDPGVEELIYGMELMRGFERAFRRAQAGNKLEAMLMALILSGKPRIARGLLPKFKLAQGGNPARLEQIKRIFATVAGERRYRSRWHA